MSTPTSSYFSSHIGVLTFLSPKYHIIAHQHKMAYFITTYCSLWYTVTLRIVRSL